jgi:hypothetical protein
VARLFIIILALFTTTNVLAQEVTFTGSVNKKTMSRLSTIQLTFTLKNAQPEGFTPPSLNNFTIISGPATSTNMHIVNGAVTRSVSYTYMIQPKVEGKITIGPAFMRANGKKMKSAPITIDVVKGAAAQKSDDPYGGTDFEADLFLRVEADRTSVYQGEQITVAYKVYMRLNVVNYDLRRLPSNSGFWSYDLDASNQIQLTNEMYEGREYRVGTIRRVALFPQRDGNLELEPLEMKVTVRIRDKRRRRSLFDDFFGDPFGFKDVERDLISNKVTIKVKPLPSEGRPADFSGMVGDFDFKVDLDKTSTTADDPITIKTRIEGRGNIKMLEPPTIKLPPNFEVYDPKVSERVSKSDGVIRGHKGFDYLVIPRVPGRYKLPPIQFSYFDPSRKEYRTLTAPEYSLEIGKGTGTSAGPAISGITKEDVALLGKDILFIKQNAGLKEKGTTFMGSILFIPLAGLPIILLLSMIFWMKRQQKLMGNLALRRNRGASRLAKRRLSKAKKHLDAGEHKEFYDEAARSIWGYLGDKLGLSGEELTKDEATRKLIERDSDEETIEQIMTTLNDCERALFAPVNEEGAMEIIYERTMKLITRLEGMLK